MKSDNKEIINFDGKCIYDNSTNTIYISDEMINCEILESLHSPQNYDRLCERNFIIKINDKKFYAWPMIEVIVNVLIICPLDLGLNKEKLEIYRDSMNEIKEKIYDYVKDYNE